MTTDTAPAPAAWSAHRPHQLSGRRALEIGAALLAMGALTGLWVVRARGRAREPQYAFDKVAVARGPLQARVTASGTVNPLVTVQVGSQVSGTIQELGADFNSVVHRGQMIARIDPRLFRTAVDQARANLLSAKAGVDKAAAQLVDAQRTAARQKVLLGKQLVAQQDYDTAATNAQVAVAQLETAQAAAAQAQAALEQAQLNLDYTTIVAPIDGVVITRNVDIGQTVAASFASPTLFLIGEDLRKMEVDSNIPEADVGRLAAGMSATFTVDAYPGETFRGTIREVRNSPQTLQNVVTYDAVIDVDNAARKLKPGMTANLSVIYADRAEVTKIANAALRFRPPAGWLGKERPAPLADRKTVWVMRGLKPEAVPVRVGVSDGSWSELLEGALQPGDLLVVEATAAQPSRAN